MTIEITHGDAGVHIQWWCAVEKSHWLVLVWCKFMSLFHFMFAWFIVTVICNTIFLTLSTDNQYYNVFDVTKSDQLFTLNYCIKLTHSGTFSGWLWTWFAGIIPLAGLWTNQSRIKALAPFHILEKCRQNDMHLHCANVP